MIIRKIYISILISVLFPCLPVYGSGNIDMSYERIHCEVNDTKLTIDIPLPENANSYFKESIGKDVCNRIKIGWIPASNMPDECDHSRNCDKAEQYSQYGVSSVQSAEGQFISRYDAVKVSCTDGSYFYTRGDQDHDYNIYCLSEDEALQRLLENNDEVTKTISKHVYGGEVIKVNWKMLEYLMSIGYVDPDSQIVDSPSLAVILELMKMHPEMWLIGSFTDPKSKEAITKHRYICEEGNEECYTINAFQPFEVNIPFGNKNYVSQWFINFCNDNSESTLYNDEDGWTCDMTD